MVQNIGNIHSTAETSETLKQINRPAGGSLFIGTMSAVYMLLCTVWNYYAIASAVCSKSRELVWYNLDAVIWPLCILMPKLGLIELFSSKIFSFSAFLPYT